MTGANASLDPAPAQPRLVVRLPGPLRSLAGGAAAVDARGATVADVLSDLVRSHPGLHRHLRTEGGGLREHVNLFLAEQDIRYLEGLATPVADGQELFIIPSIAGG